MITPWYIFSIISAIFSAGAAVGEKKVLFKESIITFSILFSLFNLILVLPFFVLADFSQITPINLLVLFIKSILEASAFVCVMVGIKNMEISKALPLLVLTPGIVAISAFIFLGESLTLLEIIGLILLGGGTYILSSEKKIKEINPLRFSLDKKAYSFLGIALFLFTTTAILDKTLLNIFKVPINEFMGFQHLFIAIIFLCFALFYGKKLEIGKSIKNSWKIILLISFFTITYRYFNLLAVKTAPVALALAIKRTSILIAIIIGGKFFKENNPVRRIIATGIMTIGAILIIFG